MGRGGLLENKCLLPAPHEMIEADSLPSPPIKRLKRTGLCQEKWFESLRSCISCLSSTVEMRM